MGEREHVAIFPASHFAASQETLNKAIREIEDELEERLRELTSQDKLLEAQRLRQRTNYDIEMIKEMGYCSGIENYSRVLDGRAPGTPPKTLLDYFPDDYLMFIDESHVTLPQVRAMYAGDRSRKDTLVDYGFRLPCAYDNRPLKFNEFESKINQLIFVSATPGQYELDHSTNIAEQIIRPTGLLDPIVEIRPVTGQIDDLYAEIIKTTENKSKVEIQKTKSVIVEVKNTSILLWSFILCSISPTILLSKKRIGKFTNLYKKSETIFMLILLFISNINLRRIKS